MDNWKDQTADEFLAWIKAELVKNEAKRKAMPAPKPLPPASPWNHDRDGHRWICIASGHGVETVECIECGVVKDFEV